MPELPEGKMFAMKDKEFYFSVADSMMELINGLSGVTSLEPYHGMLFDFGCQFSPIMHPRGLRFPVDVAFITDIGEVVEIHRLDPALNFNQGTSRKDIQYALEVPVGFFDLHGISIGDFVFDIQPGNDSDQNKL